MTILIAVAVLIAAVFTWIVLPSMPKPQRAVVSVCFALLALAIYLGLGSPNLAGKISDYRDGSAEAVAYAESLEKQLQADPAPTGMARANLLADLGRTWLQLQRYDAAEASYKEAVVASEGNPEMVLSYGKAQMMHAGGMVNKGASEAFMLAAALMPENPEPLFFLAIEKAQNGETDMAREAMETLAEAFPQNKNLQLAIKEELAKIDAVEAEADKPAQPE